MATNIGPKIGIDGEKQFRSELNSIGQQLRTLNTEMKAVTTAFDANESSQKRLLFYYNDIIIVRRGEAPMEGV